MCGGRGVVATQGAMRFLGCAPGFAPGNRASQSPPAPPPPPPLRGARVVLWERRRQQDLPGDWPHRALCRSQAVLAAAKAGGLLPAGPVVGPSKLAAVGRSHSAALDAVEEAAGPEAGELEPGVDAVEVAAAAVAEEARPEEAFLTHGPARAPGTVPPASAPRRSNSGGDVEAEEPVVPRPWCLVLGSLPGHRQAVLLRAVRGRLGAPHRGTAFTSTSTTAGGRRWASNFFVYI